MNMYIFQIYTRDRNWEFIGVIILLVATDLEARVRFPALPEKKK
jgi:hypothetical protein